MFNVKISSLKTSRFFRFSVHYDQNFVKESDKYMKKNYSI